MTFSLATTLAASFPVSRHFGIRVREASPHRVILTAPLAPHRNHSGAVFAGSLNALATLAGWAWLTIHLRRAGQEAHVVLQDSTVAYHRPATSSFRAICAAPERPELDRFDATVRRRGRGRLRLSVALETRDGRVASFAGRYVAVVPRSGGGTRGREVRS